jgi:hypothetical protein
MPNNVLLLTSTITPAPPFNCSKRSNPATRLNDYLESLMAWMQVKTPYLKEIVFCDNSGYDLNKLKKLIKNNEKCIPVEFISYTEPPPPPGVHYGFSELRLVRYALSNSHFLKHAQYFIKATGRLKFRKINRLLRNIPEDYKAIVDCRGIHAHEIGLPLRARTQLMMFEKTFYLENVDRILGTMPFRKDSHIEEFIAYCLLKSNCDNEYSNIYYRFPVNCRPSGVSGNGYNYDSFSAFAKSAGTSFCRRYLPSLYA